MKRICSIMLTLCMAFSVFMALPAAAEDTWELIENNTITFSTAATPLTGNGTADFSQEDTAGGLKITRTGATADTRVSTTIPFSTPMDNGEYYIEIEYEEHFTGGQLWASVIGDKGEGITFTVSKGTELGFAVHRTLNGNTGNGDSTASGAWASSAPAITAPPHTHEAAEKLGFQYETTGQTIQTYVDRTRAETPVVYPRTPQTTKLTGIKLELQNLPQDSYIILKGVKIWQKQAATTPETTWAEVGSTVLFNTTDTKFAASGGYAGSDDPLTHFQQEDADGGLKITKLTTVTGGSTWQNDPRISKRIPFSEELTDGVYRIELNYLTAISGGNITGTIVGDAGNALRFQLNAGTTIPLSASKTSGAAGSWLTSDSSVAKPPHTNKQDETLTIEYDTAAKTFQFYVNTVKAATPLLYPEKAATTKLTAINLEAQDLAKDSYVVFKSVKVLKKQAASEMTEAEKLAADKAAVTEASILGGQNKNEITANLTLPASPMPNGTTVTWESSNPAVLSTSGTVTRQAADTAVTFTGHFTNGAATANMVLNLTVKGTGGSGSGGGETSDWVLWNDIVFDSLTNANYTIGTSANYDAKVAGGTLALETKTTSTDAWGGAVIAKSPANKPISDGKFYIEYAFEVNRTSSTPNNTQFLTRFRKNGTDILTMTAKPNGLGMKASKTKGGTGGWSDVAKADYPTYTHAKKMTFGIIFDTADGSMLFCQDRKQIGSQKYYGMGSDPNRIDDIKIDLEGESQPGECAKLYHFKVWKLDDSAFMADYNALTLESLTDEPAGMITKNLKGLPTTLENGTTVQWTISDPAVIAQNGTVTAGSEDKQVTLTAVLTRRSLSDTKTFRLTVPAAGKADRYLYLSSDTFASEADFESWDLVRGDAEVKNENGCLFIRRQTANQDVSATKYFVTNEADDRFAAVGENIIVEYQVKINQNLREMKAEILDTDDNVVSDLMITDAGKDDDPSAVLTAGYNDGSADVAVTAAYTDNTAINVKYEINTVTGAMKVSVGGKVVATGKVKSGAKNVSAVKFSTGFEGRYGVMQLDNVNLLVESANKAATKAALDKANLTFEQIKGSTKNRADAVVENLNLPDSGWLGSEITWTTDNAAAISDAGVVTRSGEDRQVTLTATVKNGEVTETVVLPLTVKGINANNLVINAKITASSGRDTIENVNDAVLDTAWIAGAVNPYVQVDFGAAKQISRVILHELEAEGSYLVIGYVIEVSNNGSDWTTVSEGSAVGENHVIDFVPAEARYMRYRVTSQNNGKTGLNELEVYFEPSDANRVKADIQWLKTTMTGYAVNGPLELPLTGKFGSAISWVSSNEDVMSSDGTVYTKPQKDTTFTMTATVKSNQYSENQPFSKMAQGVSGSGTPGTGNGGSGGGGKGSGTALGSGGGLVNVVGENTPAPTPTPTPNNYGTFRDVPKNSWSYEYVEALAEQNIVSGYAGAFNPESSVTREEFVKMLLGVLNIEAVETSAEFSDVPAGEWYVPYVATAAKLGIVDGVGDGKFGVGRTIVRQDMALMVQRALEAADKTLQQEGTAKTFQDADAISGYAKDAVDMLVRANIISGDENGRFNPQESLTREQAAKIICLSGGILHED